MREPTETTIHEITYRYRPLPLSQALVVVSHFSRLAGPALGRLLDGASSLSTVLESGSIGGAIEALCERLDGVELMRLSKELAVGTTVLREKGPISLADVLEIHFSEDLGAWLLWLKWALTVQLGPLPAALKELVPAAPVALGAAEA